MVFTTNSSGKARNAKILKVIKFAQQEGKEVMEIELRNSSLSTCIITVIRVGGVLILMN